MNSVSDLITSLAVFGLVVSAVVSYLRVNKIWVRKHIRDVSESVSVAAALLSLFTTLPFLIKYTYISPDPLVAANFGISLVVMVVYLLIGIGFFIQDEEKTSLWVRIWRSLRDERHELTNLVPFVARPQEAGMILGLLEMVAQVDRRLDPREEEMIVRVARQWGIHRSQLEEALKSYANATISDVRDSFATYLATEPPGARVTQVYDLVRYLIEIDRDTSHSEALILEEIETMVGVYIEKDRPRHIYEVLVVPQSDDQKTQISTLLSGPELLPRAGGVAYVAGTYYSERFANEVCRHYRELGHFSAAVRNDAERHPDMLPAG